MSINFNLSYKFNKLQKIHNKQFNKIGNSNFEELLTINSHNISVNNNHFSITSGPSISSTTSNSLISNQLVSINNQYLDDELLSSINSSSSSSINNNITSIIQDLYENSVSNSENSSSSNNTSTDSTNNSNTQINNQNSSIDLSPSTVDYKNTKSDVFDTTKAKPSYKEIENWVEKYAKKYNIDPDLVMAIIKTESTFNNQCISKSGAVGLTQLMPGTAREMGLRVDSTIDERWHPEKNIEAGIAYLAKYHKIISNHFGKEDWNLTIAGYNCGPNRVIKDGKIPNITETQNYVKKVQKYWKEYKNG